MFAARILVLADRAVTAAVARALLGRAGFSNVTTRSTTDLASANVDEGRSDVVLVDVPAPPFDVTAMAPLVRRHSDGGAPRVLALTPESVSRHIANGAVEVLSWPRDKHDLGRRVGEMLGIRGLPRIGVDPPDAGTTPVPPRLVEAVTHTEDTYRRLFDEAPAALLVVAGATSRVVAANDAATRLTGYEPDHLRALDVHDLFLDGDRVMALARGPRIGERGEACQLLTRGGQVEDVHVGARRHTYIGEHAILLHVATCADKNAQARAIAERTLRDHEAGLGGQALFHSRLERAVAARGSHERIALLLIAFDRSTIGATTSTGDAPLMGAALTLRCAVRASDTTAYLGGGRFAILLEDLRSPTAAPGVAERLIGRISRADEGVVANETVVTPYVGLAFGDVLRSPDELLWRAEQAVTVARESEGTALVLFQSPLERSVRRHTTMARDLREVVAAGGRSVDAGTLYVVYQPQVEIATRRVVGVEALVRWTHPVHGDVSPETFIAIAEDVGLIPELDGLVLRQAIADARRWGFDHLPIAVNVSAIELQDPRYADRVIELLRSTGECAPHLELEITERVAIEPSSPAAANVARLRAAGVGVSIDDFGIGPAAFTTLRAVAASRIKIDRSFIADISAGEVRTVAAIAAIARGLGLETIAEGVETPEQCALLVEHGCLLAQGYLFAPPIPAPELVRFVEHAGMSIVGVPVGRVADVGASSA